MSEKQTHVIDAGVVAVICHQANKALCERLGDFSQKDWNDAPEWQRESAIKGVKYRLENPEGTPGDQHEAWSKEKKADGWVYGEVKDAVAKTHPCLVPYDELPEGQKAKDKLFISIVDALLGKKEKPAKKAASKSADKDKE